MNYEEDREKFLKGDMSAFEFLGRYGHLRERKCN